MTTTVSGPSGPQDTSAGSGTGARLHDAADALTFVGLLNVLILVGSLLGGLLLGVAPSLAAAAACSRHRILGNGGSTTRLFFVTWRSQIVRANLIHAPATAALLLLVLNVALLWSTAPALALSCAVVAALVLMIQVIAAVMDAHYDVSARSCLHLAARFCLRSPGAPLLLAAALTLLGVVTAFIPGLLPVVSIGAAAHLATALCLSFFVANDQRLASSRSLVDDDEHHPERNSVHA